MLLTQGQTEMDESLLHVIEAHADWVENVTARTSSHGGRLLSRGELDSWAGALRALLGEVHRLRK